EGEQVALVLARQPRDPVERPAGTGEVERLPADHRHRREPQVTEDQGGFEGETRAPLLARPERLGGPRRAGGVCPPRTLRPPRNVRATGGARAARGADAPRSPGAS